MAAPKRPSKAWKSFERRIAAQFGCLRNVLSGSSNRADRDPSDSTHERLHIECKHHSKQVIWTEWDKAKKASRGRKTVVMAMGSPRRHGCLFAVHSDDVDDFIREWEASRQHRENAATEVPYAD